MESQVLSKPRSSLGVTLPQYDQLPNDTALFAELRARVIASVSKFPKREWQLYFKAILFPILYGLLYAIALQAEMYWMFVLSYAAMGWTVVLVFLNLFHEAAHSNVFRSKWANQYYLCLFDLIGANSFLWKKRHVVFHHNLPNVVGWDPDMEKSDFLKIHPHDTRSRGGKYQHWIVVLYPFFLFNWFLVRDFKDFFNPRTIVRKLGPIPVVEYLKLFIFKMLFLSYMVLIPTWLTGFSVVQVLVATMVFFLVAGSHALLVLLAPHVNEFNEFAASDVEGHLPRSWFVHQLATTNDITGGTWYLRHVMGNFNFHIAHHLFPKISYLYADRVTDIVREFCLEKGLPYKSIPLFKALRAHFALIRKNGNAMEVWEEDM